MRSQAEEVCTPGCRHAGRVASWATAGFLLLQVGWVLVMPPAAGIDEFDHAFRASAVSMGHWKPGSEPVAAIFARGGMLPVRSDIAEASGPACARLPYTRPFNCRPFRSLDDDVVEIASGVDNYDPVYYGVIGTLARPFTGNGALYAMRAATIMICAGMFAMSVFLTTKWARTPWPLLALLVACLPTTVYSASIAAPNGPNMMSGLLVWAAIAALLRGSPSHRTMAYISLTSGVATMATTHTLGLLWIGLIAVSLITYVGIRRGVALLLPRGQSEIVALVIAVLGVGFQLWWLWYAHPNARPEAGLPGGPWADIAVGSVLWPLQAIAAFPLRNESAPVAVYAIALLVLGSLAIITVRALKGQRRLGWTAAMAMFCTAAVPIAITYTGYHQYGMSWQGRYGMPYSVGLFVLAASALDNRAPSLPSSIVVVGTTAWGLAQVIGQLGVLINQRQDDHLVQMTGWWVPPTAVILAIGVAATAAWFHSLQSARAILPAPVRAN